MKTILKPKLKRHDDLPPLPEIDDGEDSNITNIDEQSVMSQNGNAEEKLFPEPMGDEAFPGIVGEIIAILEPESEACRESLLAQFLVGFGNMLGRGPTRYQGSEHHLNEFVAIVGETAKARKGTSWTAARQLLMDLNPGWSKCLLSGVQSGEVIVHSIRDERSHNGEVVSEGVADKRLLVIEEELARLLATGQKTSGSTLSACLRNAWDSPHILRNAGKHSPDLATHPHISLIGHITREELKNLMAGVEYQNGFANRLLWIPARRSKKLPFPEWIHWADHIDVIKRLREIVTQFQAGQTVFDFTANGRLAWIEFYENDAALKGIHGKLAARAEAHVLRLSRLYAVLDGSTMIGANHIRSAIAFWDYCQASVGWIFSTTTGSAYADKILTALQRRGCEMSKTEISTEVFNKHISTEDLSAALELLLTSGLITESKVAGKGRPTHVYSVVK